MTIIIDLDRILVKHGISMAELSERSSVTLTDLSRIKYGAPQAIRLSTLEAMCRALESQPGDFFADQNDKHANPHLDTAASKGVKK